MRTPQYYVRTASGCYVSGKTLPNGLTIHERDAYKFDSLREALIYMQKPNMIGAIVEPIKPAQVDVSGSRAPQGIVEACTQAAAQ